MKILNNISIKEWNTFGLDVHVEKCIVIEQEQDLLNIKKEQGKAELLILGGGSNLLFIEAPKFLVLKNELKGIKIVEENLESLIVEVGAGEIWHEFVLWAVKNNYGGIENLSLIPGTVGASPIQNIGAYGVEIKDVFQSLKAWNLDKEQMEHFDLKECKFGYRDSIFKSELKGKYLISSVQFKLQKSPKEFKTTYGAIEDELKKLGLEPSVENISNVVIQIRQSKLPDPKEIGNSGSFFKNPVITQRQYTQLKEKHDQIPSYAVEELGMVKVPAGWLIEQAGWKGYREGDFGVHKNQALVLVNYGGAKGSEIYDLSTRIINDIRDKFGIELEREVNCI